MKKRTLIRAFSFMAVLILAAFGLFLKERSRSNKFKLMIENEYSSGLKDLNSSLNNITETLNKAVYIPNGSDLVSLSTKLYAEGEIAKESLSRLPNGTKYSSNLNKFLSQVGNYAISVSKSAVENDQITDEQSELMTKLYQTSKTISDAVSEIGLKYDDYNEFAKLIDNKIKENVDTDAFADSLDSIEEDLSDYPTLIYDGPFSDHILQKEPLMVTNATTKSKEACKEKAEKVFGIKSNVLSFDGNQNGKIECYRFSGNKYSISVSKNGGYIVYMRKECDVEDIKIDGLKARNTAKEFMKKIGLENMVETYYFSDEGVCVINFAYLDGQTLCYTDLIKVGVALDSGEIVLFESSGYLTNHTERSFETAKYSSEEARAKLSKKLTVKSTSIALIPTDSGGEVRCYEFLCETDEKQEILVYIGVKDLSTKNVLLLQKSDAGIVVK